MTAATTASRPRVAVLLLAAGSSSRFGSGRSKLFEPLAGARVIDVTARCLREAFPGAGFFLVSRPEFRDEARLEMAWVEGGARRQDSARRGIAAAAGTGCDAILVHDAARPFVSAALGARLLEALGRFDGVAPGLPVTDTLKRAEDGAISATIPRQGLYGVQTPQALGTAAAVAAFARTEGPEEFTDDLAVLAAAGFSTGIVPGDPSNLKITTRADLEAAERIAAERGERND